MGDKSPKNKGKAQNQKSQKKKDAAKSQQPPAPKQ
jgi:hypothetical protein